MKYSAGYQMFSDMDYVNHIIGYKEHISEVYFSWGDFPNGRNRQTGRGDMHPWEAQNKLMDDLKALSRAGIGLNLLFNATCYGQESQSRAFFGKIGDTVDYVASNYGLKSVTTTSPLIARFVKSNFENIDVRSSVNMCIGSIEGMEYVKDCFDSFYMKRELNRNFAAIRSLKKWCDENGKTLYALANSGCLNNCSAHTFHDNLVAHESDIARMDNGFAFEGICRKYLKNPDNIHNLLDYTGFIRPEDIYLYEDLFPAVKLASRVNKNPFRVLDAYIRDKKYIGSALSILEPDNTAVIYPYILENSLIKATVTENELKYENISEALVKLEE